MKNSMVMVLVLGMCLGLCATAEEVVGIWQTSDGNRSAVPWITVGNPGWDVVPNGQGHVAIFPDSSLKNSNIQSGDLTEIVLGKLVLDTTRNLDFQMDGNSMVTFAFDQDGAGEGQAVISNASYRARINFGTKNSILLRDDLRLVNAVGRTDGNRTYSISMTGTISGSGDMIIDNCQNTPEDGSITISGASNTYVGDFRIVRGCFRGQNNKPFGDVKNVVYLGGKGAPACSLYLDGSAPSISNPITVLAGSTGKQVVGSFVLTNPKKPCSCTLNGAITLNGDVTFMIPRYFHSGPVAQWEGTNMVKGVISGAGALMKKGDGLLRLFKSNTYAGGTVLKEGTISVTSGATLGTGALDVSDGATLDLAGDVTVQSLSINGKLQPKGVYAAADSEEPGVVKVAWLTGIGKLTALEGKTSGLMLLVR